MSGKSFLPTEAVAIGKMIEEQERPKAGWRMADGLDIPVPSSPKRGERMVPISVTSAL